MHTHYLKHPETSIHTISNILKAKLNHTCIFTYNHRPCIIFFIYKDQKFVHKHWNFISGHLLLGCNLLSGKHFSQYQHNGLKQYTIVREVYLARNMYQFCPPKQYSFLGRPILITVFMFNHEISSFYQIGNSSQ